MNNLRRDVNKFYNKSCLPQRLVCNGEFNCDDRSDEKYCGICYFTCALVVNVF